MTERRVFLQDVSQNICHSNLSKRSRSTIIKSRCARLSFSCPNIFNPKFEECTETIVPNPPVLSNQNPCLSLPGHEDSFSLYGSPVTESVDLSMCRRFRARFEDERRWSFGSIMSSGYMSKSASMVESCPSSRYSSSDLLHSGIFRPDIDSSLLKSTNQFSDSGFLSSTTNLHQMQVQSDVRDLNSIFMERFPKAKQTMEERLKHFIETNESSFISRESHPTDGCAHFVCTQLLQLAKNCLMSSQKSMLTTKYFAEFTNNIEKLLEQVKSNTTLASSTKNISQMIQELLLSVSRTACLLECLEFNPEDFYLSLKLTESKAKLVVDDREIPKYIMSQLRLFPSDCEQEIQNELFKFRKQRTKEASCTLSSPAPEDFQIIKQISKGSYGTVFLVKHIKTDKRFALKRISKQHLVLRNQVNQVFAERDILTFSNNPFVVSLFCSFETKHHVCLVMEYVEGGDVGSLLKNIEGPLTEELARLYFAETTLALEYIHSYGIIHRDLKPANLLITSCGHIKLTDFGLSKIGLMNIATELMDKSGEFCDGQIFGTPQYIAPEVILRQDYGKPIDWWSMGIILYEMLVGCTPFNGNTADELFNEIIYGEIEWPPEFEDHPACDLVDRLLERDPFRRLTFIRKHKFFKDTDWDSILLQKAEFVPVLDGPDDTSYFTCTKADKSEDDAPNISSEDDEISEQDMFTGFCCCSPSYISSQQESFFQFPNEIRSELSFQENSSCSDADTNKQDKPPPELKDSDVSLSFSNNSSDSGPSVIKSTRRRPFLRLRSRQNYVTTDGSVICKKTVALTRKNGGYGFSFRTYKQGDRFKHVVTSVAFDSQAHRAGLQAGSVITHVSGRSAKRLPSPSIAKLMLQNSTVLNLRVIYKHRSTSSPKRQISNAGPSTVQMPLSPLARTHSCGHFQKTCLVNPN